MQSCLTSRASWNQGEHLCLAHHRELQATSAHTQLHYVGEKQAFSTCDLQPQNIHGSETPERDNTGKQSTEEGGDASSWGPNKAGVI